MGLAPARGIIRICGQIFERWTDPARKDGSRHRLGPRSRDSGRPPSAQTPSRKHGAHALSELLITHGPVYLDNWATETRARQPSIETLSRALCSHMLDAGFSRTSLTRWLHYHKRKNNSEVYDVPGIIVLGQRLLHRHSVRFEMIVPLEAAPPIPSGQNSCWLTPTETSQWLEDWFPGTSLRQAGALKIESDSRDLGSASVSPRPR